jgi:TonB family protein
VSSINKNHEGELVAGQMLGRYELLLPIASGGMGNVWAARLKGTRGFRKLVAIKTVLRAVEDDRFEEMLYREATLASQLHHPNIVETLELGDNAGSLYLAMELVQGESLSFILREAQSKGGIPLVVAVNLIGQVCRGLEAAHELRDEFGTRVGLVHRDISPPNVLVTYSGTVKIVDFGVATTAASDTSGSGEIKGKISYLAPEQLRGEEVDARVDVFATGILLYLMTVGRHPYRVNGESGTIGRILSDLPATSPSAFVDDYPEALEAVLMRAMEKRRERRFPSSAAFLEALEQAMPQAFGPEGEKAVVSFIQGLLNERMVERRATLRMAEELSERQSHDSVMMSVPAIAQPTRPPTRGRSSRAMLALGMAVFMLGGAATAARGYIAFSPPPVAAQAVATPNRVLAARPLASPRATVTSELGAVPAPTSLLSDVAATASGASPRAVAGRPAQATHRSRGDAEPKMAAPEPSAFAPEGPESDGIAPVAALNEPPTTAIVPPPLSSPSAPAMSIPLVPPASSAPRSNAPRQLTSRLGHERLTSNPNLEASKMNLPRALLRAGATMQATVKLCVTAAGKVSSVNVLRSAGSAVDQQLTGALSRWHYRPLLEDGRGVPFCYTLNYEIGQ